MDAAATFQIFRSTDELIRHCRVAIAEAQMARQLSMMTRSETIELLALVGDKMHRLKVLSRRPSKPF